MLNTRCFFLLMVSALLCSATSRLSAQVKAGDVLPAWSEGYLDIHTINTGKGECSFLILPDGTTMLVDAGALIEENPRTTTAKPDASRTTGEWISRYIQQMLKGVPEKKLNHVLLTHFHDDHMGGVSPNFKKADGGYYLTGITEVCEYFPFDKLVDRGWPDYNFPSASKGEDVLNYVEFAKWTSTNKKTEVERFQPGANDQFVLKNNPKKYPNFEIRNIAVNGQVWTGVADNVRNHFPLIKDLSPKEYPSENMCSAAFRMSYGKFDYFNGGDITSGDPGTWRDIETPVGLVTGPTEVCVANHHAYYDAMGVPFLQAVRPKAIIIHLWSAGQPATKVLAGMLSSDVYPGERDIFSTNLMEETKIVVGSRLDKLKSTQGHIVVRVNPGGDSFYIYILNDSAEDFRVKAAHGPYICD